VAQKRRRKPINATTKKYLQGLAKKTRFTYTQLASVYRRGQGAYLSSGSRAGASMEAWARGRVRSFVTGKGGARKADADIYKKTRKSK